MDKTETKQDKNVVDGILSGRDTTININPSKTPSYMERLIEKFKEEKKGDVEFNDVIEKLQHYQTKIRDEPVKGLEQKLVVGNQEDRVQYAIRYKEQFAMNLTKNQLYQSAQEICTYILAEVCTRFNSHVYPAIKNGSTTLVINELIQKQVIDPVQELLGENVLELYADDVNGMIYFLTGNCHIKWV